MFGSSSSSSRGKGQQVDFEQLGGAAAKLKGIQAESAQLHAQLVAEAARAARAPGGVRA